MENPKIRIESDGHYTQVWVNGEKISDRACAIDFHAEFQQVYCEIEKYVYDTDGNKVIVDDDALREKVVVVDTMEKGDAE